MPGVTLKYRFADQDTRRRFRQLILSIVGTLQDEAERRGVTHVDWAFYREREDGELRTLEEAVLELAQLMASLATVDGEGTRHRSVYRLCQAFPDSLAFVVSQDGAITIVHTRDRKVLCWEQRTFGL